MQQIALHTGAEARETSGEILARAGLKVGAFDAALKSVLSQLGVKMP